MVNADCIEFMDEAQSCARDCGNVILPNRTNNLLTECFFNRTDDLASCCLMEGNCFNSTTEAYACLDDEYYRVKEAAGAYFNCILTPLKCWAPGFCVNLLAGGYGTGYPNDFALITRQADTCEDPGLNSFGKGVCNVLGMCCPSCEAEVAELVNAVMDDILVPTYGQPNVTSCSINPLNGTDKTCAYYKGVEERKLYSLGADLAGPASLADDNSELAAAYTQECHNSLINDVVVHNESHGVGNYFECLYKKTGKAAAELLNASQESSSISLSLGPTLVLSTMASVMYAFAL